MITTCIISFIVGAMLMMCAILLVAYRKDKEPRNKVRFFLRRDLIGFSLFIECKNGYRMYICSSNLSERFGLNLNAFSYMKEREIREVFLNLED